MGKIEEKVAPVFKNIHFESGKIHAIGEYQSQKGKGLLNSFFCLLIGVPIIKGKEKFKLEINEDRTEWKRTFGVKKFITRTKIEEALFKERKGIFEFEFLLTTSKNKLNYEFKKFKILTIPVPNLFSIKPNAVCKAQGNNKWTFEVETKSPFGDLIMKYSGEAEIISEKMTKNIVLLNNKQTFLND